MFHRFHSRLIRATACLYSQTPQKNARAEKFDDTVDTERFEKKTFRGPTKEKRRCPLDRHPA
jgi:hypothetical protein